jgi:hypothetical protein
VALAVIPQFGYRSLLHLGHNLAVRSFAAQSMKHGPIADLPQALH